MSTLADPSFVLDRLVLSSRPQQALRATVLVAAVAFLGVVWVRGEDHPWLTAAGVVLAVLAAGLPETNAPLALLVYLAGLWLLATPDRLDGWTLAAALTLFAVHLACLLVAHGPAGLRPHPRLLRAWLLRGAACLSAALLVWLGARGLGALHRPPSGMMLGLALVLVLVWCALVALRLGGSRAEDAA